MLTQNPYLFNQVLYVIYVITEDDVRDKPKFD
jgi:hypothetical protein